MTSPAEDEFTELVDADIPRVDLVDKAANGTRFLIAKSASGTGLLDPEFVRELVAKAEPHPPIEEKVTMSGTPAAIARLIHEAAERQVTKAEMTTASINDLPDSDFAYIEPGGEKDEHGRTAPRSKRHFPIHDEAHTRNALSRAPQSPFGDKAMPKIRAAAKKFGIEVAKEALAMDDDSLDAMSVLADADAEYPGMDTDPGSPAWEAIDAATARKWTSIAVRLRNALCVMAEREMIEAATADPDDAIAAWDLKDAECALDYVIDRLAGFAVEEQAEAELAAEMEAVGKALHGLDVAALDTFEALAPIAKAGRVLSSTNEAAIRGAVESLQKVLASLPAAPTTDDSGRPVAKTANEEPDMPQPTTAAETTAAAGEEPAMGAQQPEPKPVAGLPVTEMTKADGEQEMVAVYDKKGNLVGIVAPDRITRIAESDEEPDGDEDGADGETDGAPQTTDLTPQPQDEAGTPADAVADGVTKQTDNINPDVLKSSILDMVKSILDEHGTTQSDEIAKQRDAVLELVDIVETLKGQIRALEEQPAEPRVFTNGAVPPAHQMRGQDRGSHAAIDVTKAREQKDRLYKATDATEQNRIAQDMQADAIAALQEIHQRRV